MIITIDGPAGSGKSTAARQLAAALEIPYLDTGAMYRAVALKALNTKTPIEDHQALAQLTNNTNIELDCGPTHTRVIMDGKDVSETIRSMPVSEITSNIARAPQVRKALIEKQHRIAQQLGSLVTEGRDQGSIVFPDADVKFFLNATDTKRAERRYREMIAEGQNVKFEDVLVNVRQRDQNDQIEWIPLLDNSRVYKVDTTDMTVGQMVQHMKNVIEKFS